MSDSAITVKEITFDAIANSEIIFMLCIKAGMINTRIFRILKKINPKTCQRSEIVIVLLCNGISFAEIDEAALNESLVEVVIEKIPTKYSELPEKYKANAKIAQIAFTFDGSLISFAPQKIKKNLELATIAVKSKPSSLGWVDSSIQKSLESITKTLSDKNHYNVIEHSAKYPVHKLIEDYYKKIGCSHA